MARQPVYFEEPKPARWLFGSKGASYIWLLARLYVGWSWIVFGWRKVFGGQITAKFWNWEEPGISLFGDANVGWVRSGVVSAPDGSSLVLGIGDRVAMTADLALNANPPQVWFAWYKPFLEWVSESGHAVIGPAFAVSELVLGFAILVGGFVGIAAFLLTVMNLSTLLTGFTGPAPVLVLLQVLLILAWRNAGYFGADRFLLPGLGTPWQPGEALRKRKEPEAPEPVAR